VATWRGGDVGRWRGGEYKDEDGKRKGIGEKKEIRGGRQWVREKETRRKRDKEKT
jgi:hypothetical protein